MRVIAVGRSGGERSGHQKRVPRAAPLLGSNVTALALPQKRRPRSLMRPLDPVTTFTTLRSLLDSLLNRRINRRLRHSTTKH